MNTPKLILAGIAFLLAVTSCSDNAASSKEYVRNSADERLFDELETGYSVAKTVGERTGANSLEVLIGAINAVDWSGGSPQLREAVKEINSIKSGEDPISRGKKMDKFIEINAIYQ